jgi:hypothetical protein
MHIPGYPSLLQVYLFIVLVVILKVFSHEAVYVRHALGLRPVGKVEKKGRNLP